MLTNWGFCNMFIGVCESLNRDFYPLPGYRRIMVNKMYSKNVPIKRPQGSHNTSSTLANPRIQHQQPSPQQLYKAGFHFAQGLHHVSAPLIFSPSVLLCRFPLCQL